MRSLRAELGIWLLTLSTVVGLLSAAISFMTARSEAWRFFDQQLRIMTYNVDVSGGGPNGSEVISTAHDPEDDFLVQVWSANGQVIRHWPSDLYLPKATADGFQDVSTPDGMWRRYAVVTPGYTVQVSQRFEVRDELAREAAYRSLLPILAALPLTWLVLGFVIDRVLRRLDGFAADVLRQTATSDQLLPIENLPRELRPFVASIEAALSRMRETLEAQRRFVADAAHALRTPLAVFQTQIDNLRHVVKDTEGSHRLDELERGLRRGTRLVAQLLRMARCQSDGGAERELKLVDLVAVATESVAELLPLADLRHQDIGIASSEPASIWADHQDIRTLIDNLIENAIRYTPEYGVVDVSIGMDNGCAMLEFRDSGPGIPEEQLHRVVEPFYRVARAQAEGSGLGLAIAASIAQRYGAQLDLRNRTDRSGLIVTVRLPTRG